MKADLVFDVLTQQHNHSMSCFEEDVINQESPAMKTPLHSSQQQQCGESFNFFPQSIQKTTSFHISQTVDSTSNKEKTLRKKRLSTEELMRIAGTRYIQFSDERYEDTSMVMHPFGHALSGLSEDETKDVETVHLLLKAADKLEHQQFQGSSRLLTHCEWVASHQGNPVQRIVHYFLGALQERIGRETGVFTQKKHQNQEKNGSSRANFENGIDFNLAYLKYHQHIPLSQVMQFTVIQSLIENVGSSKKVHIIDLEIRSGVHWTAFMQALSERQHNLTELKITAIGRIGKCSTIEKTGNQLATFARSMNIQFSFRVVYVYEMDQIREEMFEIKADEALAVFSKMFLRLLITNPSCIEKLMTVIRNLNPVIMVIQEIEANHNSTSFVKRFIEALFHFSAQFDCLETCMDRSDENRTEIEAIFGDGITNMIAMEGSERYTRNVKIEVWREFFKRFKMVEVGFSESSLYQARLVAKKFESGRFVNIDNNGKTLIIGWRGTPLHSVSAWRFGRVNSSVRPILGVKTTKWDEPR